MVKIDSYLKDCCREFETYPELQRHFELDAGFFYYRGRLAVIITKAHEYSLREWPKRNLGRAQFELVGADWDDYA